MNNPLDPSLFEDRVLITAWKTLHTENDLKKRHNALSKITDALNDKRIHAVYEAIARELAERFINLHAITYGVE